MIKKMEIYNSKHADNRDECLVLLGVNVGCLFNTDDDIWNDFRNCKDWVDYSLELLFAINGKGK